MIHSTSSELRNVTKQASSEFYDELQTKTLLMVHELEESKFSSITVNTLKRKLGINDKVLTKILSSLSSNGYLNLFVESTKGDNLDYDDIKIELTKLGKDKAKHAYEELTRKLGLYL